MLNWKNDESEKLLKKNANDMKNVLSRFDCCHFNAARIIFLRSLLNILLHVHIKMRLKVEKYTKCNKVCGSSAHLVIDSVVLVVGVLCNAENVELQQV